MHTSPALQDSLKGALVDPAVNLEIGLMRQRLRIKDSDGGFRSNHLKPTKGSHFGSQLWGLTWGLLCT